MPLILESNKDNILEFQHAGGSVALYYSDPTTKQRIAYSNRIVKRKGNKIKNELAATRLAGGNAICTGMREGDFAIPAANEAGFKLISSNPESPDYRKDWKKLLHEYQGDYLMLLGAHVFEGASIEGDVVQGEEMDSLDEDEDDDEGEAEQTSTHDTPAGLPDLDDELGK
jgi:hypothetical protein